MARETNPANPYQVFPDRETKVFTYGRISTNPLLFQTRTVGILIVWESVTFASVIIYIASLASNGACFAEIAWRKASGRG